MFPNQTAYVDCIVTYIDNNNKEQEAHIICPYLRGEEYFEKKYKGKYIKILKCAYKNFLLQ
jgi:hypothetical protein